MGLNIKLFFQDRRACVFTISTFPIIHFVSVFLAPQHTKQFSNRLSSSSLGIFNCSKRNVNNAFAKLLVCVMGNVKMANKERERSI